MKKILLLGTSLVSVEIVQTAKMMGCYTIVTDNLKPEYSPAKNVADEYWMINTNDLDTLEQKCKEENVDAVFAGVSEFNLDMVIELTSRLGLPCYAEKRAWQFARDKHAFKQKCNATGISVAEEYFVSDSAKPTELNEIHYPVVVKPVDGSGNKGLSICRNAEELKLGREKANYNSNRKEIVIEKYLQGEELLCFYYVTEDSIKHAYSIRVFKQPGYPSFVYPFVTSAVENNQVFDEQINDKCISLLKSIGCRSGIAWIQFIKDENSHYYALEMGHRLSAESDGKSIKKITGTNAVEWMLDTAMGKTHTFSMLPVTAQPPI